MEKNIKNIKNNTKGLTLIEILLALSIMVVLIIAWQSFILRSYRGISFGREQLSAIRSAQKGITIMTREIREASTAEDGSYPLEKADDNEIIFYSDIDEDQYVERVRYFVENNTLKKGTVEPSGSPFTYNPDNETITTIAQFIRNNTSTEPIFTYYNGDYPLDNTNNPLPTPSRLIDTKLIHIFVKINVDPKRSPKDFVLESDVQLRNLKTNL